MKTISNPTNANKVAWMRERYSVLLMIGTTAPVMYMKKFGPKGVNDIALSTSRTHLIGLNIYFVLMKITVAINILI